MIFYLEVTMSRRKIRDEGEARRCLAAQDASDLCRSAWTRRHGVDGRSLQGWRVRLRRRAPIELAELRVVELVPSRVVSPSAPPEPSVGLSVHCGDFSVMVEPGFSEALLARVLTLMAQC